MFVSIILDGYVENGTLNASYTTDLPSLRKEGTTPQWTPEPSKPLHRYTTVSRISFKRSLFSGPKVLGGIDSDSFLSTPGYSDKAKQTYLQQCFQTTKILGEGSFGRVRIFAVSLDTELWTYLVTRLNLVCKEYHRNCTSKLIIINFGQILSNQLTVICVNTWLHLITVNTQLI